MALGHIRQVLGAEQLAQHLQQTADGLVVALHAPGAAAHGGRDLEQQVDVTRQQGVDLHQVLDGDRLAAVGEELEVGAMQVEQAAQLGVGLRGLLQQALVDDVADVGRGQVDPQLGREAVLGPDQEGLVRLLVQLLLAQGQEPGAALERGPERGGEGAQPVDPVLAGEDVLGHLVHHQEEGRIGAAEAQHVADGAHRLFGGFVAGMGARTAGEPAHRVRVVTREEPGHHQGEVLFREGPVLDRFPGLAERFQGGVLETGPLAIPLQVQLEVRDQGIGRAVAQAPLKLADDGRVDLLVVPGHAAHVEHDSDGVDLAPQGGPGLAQLGGPGGGVAAQPGLGQRGAVRQGHAVKREAEQLGEARLARAVKAGDPDIGQVRPPGRSSSAAMAVSRWTYCSWMPLGTRRWLG